MAILLPLQMSRATLKAGSSANEDILSVIHVITDPNVSPFHFANTSRDHLSLLCYGIWTRSHCSYLDLGALVCHILSIIISSYNQHDVVCMKSINLPYSFFSL